MRFSLVKFQVHSRDKIDVRLPRKQVLDEMADKQKQDPEKVFLHLLRGLAISMPMCIMKAWNLVHKHSLKLEKKYRLYFSEYEKRDDVELHWH